jgi:acetyl esterase/lipase
MLDVAYGSDPLQKMDVYLPANRSATNTKVIVMIHGGAWSLGDKSDFNSFVDSLQQRLPEYAIVNINYRLANFGSNNFPTQENDTKASIEYLYSKRSEYFISDKFVLVGASAGAHLALLQAYKYSSPVKIKAVVDFFGPTDMIDLYNNPGTVPQASIEAIVGATPTSNPDLYESSSPLHFVTNQSCPTIILQGGNDPLVNPVSQSGALKDKLDLFDVAHQYVLYPGKGHGDDWDNATYFDAFNKIQAFLAANVF